MIYVKEYAAMTNSKTNSNPYSGGPLDRAAEIRDDEDRLTAHLESGTAIFLPVWQLRNFVRGDDPDDAQPEMAGISADIWHQETIADTTQDIEHIFLGLRDGVAYFTADVSHIEAPDTHPSLGENGRFEDLRQIGPLLASEDATLLAYARGIIYWHSRHRYCGECGATTQIRSAGHRRVCTNSNCAAEQFPRTDPAVIMLVHDGDRIIMARSPRFLPAMHSVLAGFLEPGESLEDTVAREVREEVGVDVTDIEYQSSQPWPFPASLMVGFRARALTFDLNPDPAELESAAWYTRAELLASPEDDTFRLPRKDSIARRLIENWLKDPG